MTCFSAHQMGGNEDIESKSQNVNSFHENRFTFRTEFLQQKVSYFMKYSIIGPYIVWFITDITCKWTTSSPTVWERIIVLSCSTNSEPATSEPHHFTHINHFKPPRMKPNNPIVWLHFDAELGIICILSRQAVYFPVYWTFRPQLCPGQQREAPVEDPALMKTFCVLVFAE